jgi:hypothetical protein
MAHGHPVWVAWTAGLPAPRAAARAGPRSGDQRVQQRDRCSKGGAAAEDGTGWAGACEVGQDSGGGANQQGRDEDERGSLSQQPLLARGCRIGFRFVIRGRFYVRQSSH